MHRWVPITDAHPPQWHAMDAETRARAYSPSSVVEGGIGPYIQAYADQSKAAYAKLKNYRTLRYGPKPSNTIDIACPNTNTPAPLNVFFHGGYWQELGKQDAFFAAPYSVANGVGYAAVDYTLAPHASLDHIVEECCAALTHLHDNAASLGIDRDAIILSGSSAGAHLAAMCCLRLGQQYRHKGLALLSGIYDLAPLIGTYINTALDLDFTSALKHSPQYADLSEFVPTLLAWGAQETDEFKRQSQNFASALNQSGIPVRNLEMIQRNHFDIVLDLAHSSILSENMLALTR